MEAFNSVAKKENGCSWGVGGGEGGGVGGKKKSCDQ